MAENNNSAAHNISFLTEVQKSKRQKGYDDKRQGLIEKVVEKAEKEAYEEIERECVIDSDLNGMLSKEEQTKIDRLKQKKHHL